jgi:translocation-and-assembly-module (TAM) inner membrane subunit TamB-like protein
VAEDPQADVQAHRRRWFPESFRGRTAIALAIFAALVLIFHRPILLAVGRKIALYYAAKQNLKIDFRLEGNPFTRLTARNFQAFPTGPSAIESIDIDQLHIDYNLFGFARHGLARLFDRVEARSARVVLNPAKAPLRARPPKPQLKLPRFFPKQVRVVDGTLVVRNQPYDFVAEHIDVDLNPRSPGELRIGTLQLPAGDSWSNVTGQTSYASKNLIIRDILLSDQEQIHLLDVDASQIDKDNLGINLDWSIGGGQLSAGVILTETKSSLNAKLHLVAQKVAAESLNKFLILPADYLSGEIEDLALDGAGVIDQPRTWRGTLSVRMTDVHRPEIDFKSGLVEISASQGTAVLQSADIIQEKNEFHLRGTIELPPTFKEFGRTPANLEISGRAPDLQQLTSRLTGSAEFTGKINIVGATIEANLGVTADSVGFPDGTVEKLSSTLRASKMIASAQGAGSTAPATANKPTPATAQKPWFADLHTAMEFDLTGVRYGEYVVDSVHGSLSSLDDVLGFDQVTLRRKQNELTVRGRYRLPQDVGEAPSQPVQIDVALSAPEAGDFWATDSPNKIRGPLQMTAQVERNQQATNGQISISGSNLKMRELVVRQLSVQSSISNNLIFLNDSRATLNDTDFLNATGTLNLQKPYHYNGKVSARVANLSVLQPLLRASGNANQLAGSFALDWEGNGNAQTVKNSGTLKLVLDKGRYGNLQSLRANIDASYSPDGLDVPIIFFATSNMDFQAVAQTKGETLEISKIQLDQGQARFASGYASIPFVWGNLGTNAAVVPSSGKVFAVFQSENLDVKRFFEDVGVKAMTSGMLSARLDAKGTPADLDARLNVQMRDLRVEQWPKMEPASFELNAQAVHDRLSVSGKLQQTRIQPLEVNASMPFDIPKIARARKVPDDTSITAKARLPRSSVNFIRQFVPEIEQLDGQLGLDVDVSGTIGRPVLSGAGDMTVNVARFTNATLPALRNFNVRLTFARDALTLDRFGGEVAGGPFRMSGRVTFPKLTEPTLDLQLKADSVLVARNDTLTARTDADLKVAGPFAAATVAGNVALTNSHILKNIDLIPIGLPGRPAPQPPSARPEFSVASPPFRDWKFDVAIKTKDPVLIRGNLATGGATSDLKLTGTGLHPQLQGTVQMQNVEATLPFSRLDVTQGLLTFQPNDPMNPKISLQGTSVIRDYTVRVYVYGTVLSPEAIFTSEPPLAQEEIISLIATGATRQELSSGNVLAGRAAMLLVQQLYRQIFKKGEPTQSNTAFNQLDLELGTVDPRTGQQQATVRFKINDKLVLTGDVGVRGDFRGRLKYLIRFR